MTMVVMIDGACSPQNGSRNNDDNCELPSCVIVRGGVAHNNWWHQSIMVILPCFSLIVCVINVGEWEWCSLETFTDFTYYFLWLNWACILPPQSLRHTRIDKWLNLSYLQFSVSFYFVLLLQSLKWHRDLKKNL